VGAAHALSEPNEAASLPPRGAGRSACCSPPVTRGRKWVSASYALVRGHCSNPVTDLYPVDGSRRRLAGQCGRRALLRHPQRELGGRWASVEQARLAVCSWIAFYNHRGGTPPSATTAPSATRGSPHTGSRTPHETRCPSLGEPQRPGRPAAGSQLFRRADGAPRAPGRRYGRPPPTRCIRTRATSDPRASALGLYESAFQAGARLAGWDIGRLACPGRITDRHGWRWRRCSSA
jgi:hypothetical protein